MILVLFQSMSREIEEQHKRLADKDREVERLMKQDTTAAKLTKSRSLETDEEVSEEIARGWCAVVCEMRMAGGKKADVAVTVRVSGQGQADYVCVSVASRKADEEPVPGRQHDRPTAPAGGGGAGGPGTQGQGGSAGPPERTTHPRQQEDAAPRRAQGA